MFKLFFKTRVPDRICHSHFFVFWKPIPVKIMKMNFQKDSHNENSIMSSPMRNKCQIKKKRKTTTWGPWSKCLDSSCDTDLAIKIRRLKMFNCITRPNEPSAVNGF